MKWLHRWYELRDDDRQWAERVASARDNQKRGFASSRYWNGRSHYFGCLAERGFAWLSGLQADGELRLNGDEGSDFPGVDVKAVTYTPPYLKHPEGAQRWAPCFVLMALREDRWFRYCGWTTAETLRTSPVRDWGHGPQHWMFEGQLNRESLPDT